MYCCLVLNSTASDKILLARWVVTDGIVFMYVGVDLSMISSVVKTLVAASVVLDCISRKLRVVVSGVRVKQL